jgi:hypothetical protein
MRKSSRETAPGQEEFPFVPELKEAPEEKSHCVERVPDPGLCWALPPARCYADTMPKWLRH